MTIHLSAISGGTTADQMYWKGWSDGVPSFTDAAKSPEKVVFIDMGTNDAGCLHKPYNGNADFCPDTPPDSDPNFSSWYANQMFGIGYTMKVAIDQLTAAGKCVVWAGPREIDFAPYGDHVQDFTTIDNFLKSYTSSYNSSHPNGPGKAFYADWDSFVKNNPALNADLVQATDDPIHPDTAAAQQATVALTLFYAKYVCGLNLN